MSAKIEIRTCRKCGVSGDRSVFTSRGSLCGKCVSRRNVERKKERKLANPGLIAEQRRAWRRTHWMKEIIWHGSRSSARVRGLENTLTLEDLWAQWNRQEGKCFWLGVTLGNPANLAPRDPQMPSIDRLDPDQGYVPGNFVFVALPVNIRRNRMTADEFSAFVARLGDRAPAYFGVHDDRTRVGGHAGPVTMTDFVRERASPIHVRTTNPFQNAGPSETRALRKDVQRKCLDFRGKSVDFSGRQNAKPRERRASSPKLSMLERIDEIIRKEGVPI